jgi:redox-sensitive bicupin YhaK (pirin superfamily)
VPIRVVRGEINARDATARVVVPTGAEPKWPPFERVTETIATPRRPFPPHGHVGAEVLTYLIEGSATYSLGENPPEVLVAGSAVLLTAPSAVSHAIRPAKGQAVRWFSVVAAHPATERGSPRLQSARAIPPLEQADGTTVRRLVGPGSTLESSIGMECEAIEFRSPGTSFRRVGRDRVAVCYALAGKGTIDNVDLEGGEAALIDDSAGVALHGDAEFRVTLTGLPKPA